MIWTEYLRFQSFDRSYLVDLPNLNSATDTVDIFQSDFLSYTLASDRAFLE